ncbi:MAG: ABC transporter permease, partial [Acidobacteria bacterium]|nr:ABC transporter permease [Acidobacteriota bacterium]
MLRSTPAVTVTAILSLALGIGANTSMFTIVNAALLRPLPVTAPDELAFVFSGTRDSPWSAISYPTYLDYRNRNDVFSGLAAYGEISVSLSGDGAPDLVRGVIVTGNYFDVLGVGATRGRVFTPADDRMPGAHPVVVIAHDLWKRRFGGDPGLVGRDVTINARPYTVIGVTPEGFRGSNLLEDIGLYVPMMMQASVRPPRGGYSGEMDPDLLNRRGSGWLTAIGRLRPGMGFDQAQAGLLTVARQLEQAYPDTNRNQIASVYPVSRIDPRADPALRAAAWLLMAVVGLVLLIATANVTNLLLARTVARRREIAMRLALGGSRARLIRQLLTESLLLASAGGVIGILAAAWTLDALERLVPAAGIFSFTLDLPLDSRVLAFTSLVAVVSSVLVGLAPALQSSHPDLLPALKAGPLDAAGRRRPRARSALVVAQLAMSVVLLVVAGLFVKSFWRAQGIATGFDVDAIASANLQIDILRYPKPRAQQFYRDVIERVEALPGVESASMARVVPLAGSGRTTVLRLEGDPQSSGPASAAGDNRLPTVAANVVGLRYFDTMGIRVRAGRDFSDEDVEGAPLVVVVNETFASRYFRGQPALGRRLRLGGQDTAWREIVGVVRDSKYRTLGELPAPFVYQPVAQQHETGMTLLVRTKREPSAILGELRHALLALEPDLPLFGIQPLSALLASS